MIRERLEVVSYIHKGVRVTFENEADEDEGGLPARGRAVRLPEEDRRGALRRSRCTTRRSCWSARASPRLDLVLQWTEATDEHIRSYVNGIPTGSGGTHENGLRAGLGKAVRNYIDTHNLVAEGRHARPPRTSAKG